jgi:predicted RNase H-like HicB family nuclease
LKKQIYPAVMERGPKGTFGGWLPDDFPGCGAGGRSQEETIEKAERALAQAVDLLLENNRPLPQPTPIERIALPRDCQLQACFIVGVDPPNPSERVNVYLPRNLIDRIDKRAAELGNESVQLLRLRNIDRRLTSFGIFPTAPRSKVHKTGRLRTKA